MSREMDILMGVQRFENATVRAMMQEMIGRLRGKSTQLQSFDEMREKFAAWQEIGRGLQDIPLNRIVGSVGRHQDFTRSFLPKSAISKERWSHIFAEVVGELGLPPVEVYDLCGDYYVRDGHHRVSVARELGFKTVQAYVTEVQVPVTGDNCECA
ncbi:MAG: hypothetical protein K8L97_30540 [Anaerolineae bacterium]|nr:hypothetical protein [Anaerolineae bacterium]